MTVPRLEINLSKIHSNAYEVVKSMGELGISVTAITKVVLGVPEIVEVLLKAGVCGIGDSHIETVEAMRQRHNKESILMIRSPMISQADRIVASSSMSCNTESEVIKSLSIAAKKLHLVHDILLMVELGDLREGILPEDMDESVQQVLDLPNLFLKGIGTNLACRNGVGPNTSNMATLSVLASSIESNFGINLEIVSGGNSASIDWALSGSDLGRVNNLRLGEAIFLGREALHQVPIRGMFVDAFQLVAEVIEIKYKPSGPDLIYFSSVPNSKVGKRHHRPSIRQSILGIGYQDIEPEGLTSELGLEITGSSSDHLIIHDKKNELSIGSEVTFQLNYDALLRAMTSPFVAKEFY